ncbi:chaperonin Cpn60/TCP-1 [Ramicandelaber brevisporus]|nr:chaperonin Cpn60/TCP-1 [Ramicandelaber brevisporus]
MQDEITGDGTTTIVLYVGEMLRLCQIPLTEDIHRRILANGFDLALEESLKFLQDFQTKPAAVKIDRELLISVARTSLSTKLDSKLANAMAEVVVDAILTIKRDGKPIDLHMVEIMKMQHRTETESRLVRGLVLDHGARHPDMPKQAKDAFILTANVSLEYEKTEINSGFYYSNAEQRMKLIESERKFVDEKVKKIVDLKNIVCTPDNKKTFVLINQKGIDPLSLDILAKHGIIALRRAKRRNMERLQLACGGTAVNSVDDLTPDALGHAGHVYEHVIGEDKFTFVEDVENPESVTILIKGPNPHTIQQINDAVRDGLRAVRNAVEDQSVVPGAGAFQVACAHHLLTKFKPTVSADVAHGVEVFAKALLIVPKTLAANGGYTIHKAMAELQNDIQRGQRVVGLDLKTGEPMDPTVEGVWDNACVVKHQLTSAAELARNLLLVDSIVKAGRSLKQ